MLNFIVKADRKKGSQRITIPKLIRKNKKWDNAAYFKLCVQDDDTVTIEEYLTHDDIRKETPDYPPK